MKTRTVEHNGELWIVDFDQSFGQRAKTLRSRVKANGGRQVWHRNLDSQGECTETLWQDQDGQFWFDEPGWYADAPVYPAYDSPF